MIPEIGDVHAAFTGISALARERFAGEPGGKLLLYAPLDRRGVAVALAGNIAGMATLGVDGDGERLRQGLRLGFCDFVVNHLDEALRILKNEVRKRQPVSVCLEAGLDGMLRESAERGLQPDVLAVSPQGGREAELRAFREHGSILLGEWIASETPSDGVTWMAESAPARWLPMVDALAAEVISGDSDDERRRWLRLAPRYLGRSIPGRYLRMSVEEADRFAALVAEKVAAGAIGSRILIGRASAPKKERLSS